MQLTFCERKLRKLAAKWRRVKKSSTSKSASISSAEKHWQSTNSEKCCCRATWYVCNPGHLLHVCPFVALQDFIILTNERQKANKLMELEGQLGIDSGFSTGLADAAHGHDGGSSTASVSSASASSARMGMS